MSSDSNSNTWSDRRGMFQSGKEVHEPGRKLSGGGIVEAVRKASVSSSSDDTTKSTPTKGRRSSGAAFENLTTLKRGSQDYGDRRASHSEMQGPSGMVSGWFNKTFRGMGTADPTVPEQPKKEARRGIME